MKKIAAILLVIIALAAGCGRREASPESGIVESAPESEAEALIPTTDEAAGHNAKINPADVHIIQFDDPDPGDMIAVLTTSEGEIRIRLFHDHAPETVDAFAALVRDGHYNGQQFHTIVNGYKIEAGSTSGTDNFPEEGEFSLDLWNFRGAVALSNNGADFMIVQAEQCLNPVEELERLNFPRAVIDKYAYVGGAPHQDWKNPVFGAVISGMDVVDKIAAGKAGEEDNSTEPVLISKAEIETV